jgi:hypothetical protein
VLRQVFSQLPVRVTCYAPTLEGLNLLLWFKSFFGADVNLTYMLTVGNKKQLAGTSAFNIVIIVIPQSSFGSIERVVVWFNRSTGHKELKKTKFVLSHCYRISKFQENCIACNNAPGIDQIVYLQEA